MDNTNWKIYFDGQTAMSAFGLAQVQSAVREAEGYLPASAASLEEDANLIVISTQKEEMTDQPVPDGEGYRIVIRKHPLHTGRQMILITSHTEAGLMYGCIDFAGVVLPKAGQRHSTAGYYFKNPFGEGFEEGTWASSPDIAERGLWTWGHVIYDYRGLFDHMALCRLNAVTIWNDFMPLNAREVWQYAHDRNIRVIWGLSLNWDEKDDITRPDVLEKWSGIALKRCQELYDQGIADGVYVQTFTETASDNIGGASIAENAVRWVNQVYSRLKAAIPQIDFRLGLHATSVFNTPEVMAGVHPDVKIIWEDAGQFPYNYVPESGLPGFRDPVKSTRTICSLRGGQAMGATLKGMFCLDWGIFQHMKGPAAIGCASKQCMESLLPAKKKIWRYVQSHWLTNSEVCREVVELYRAAANGQCYLCGLVEDGLFEMKVWFAPALFAAILWDCRRNVDELVTETAQRPYVTFA